MRTRNAVFTGLFLLVTACGDDTTIITTFHTVSASDTNITFVTTPQSGGDDGPTSAGDTDGDGATEVDPTTFGGSATSIGDTDTTSATDDSTTAEQIDPVQDPPAGCAHFVEVNGAQSPATNYMVIDSSGCQRGQMSINVGMPGFTSADFDLGPVNGCHAWGGPKSPAGIDGTVIGLPVPEGPILSYWLTLFVNGEVSDDVRIPDILHTQQWDEKPLAPTTPIRRADDFSWRVIPEHVPGCDLLVP